MLENVTQQTKHCFEVINYDTVSLLKLCEQLQAKLATETKIVDGVAVSLTVTYALNAIAWRYKKFVKPSWHLVQPDTGNVLHAVKDVVERIGYCNATQIVAVAAVKYPSGDKVNRLVVEITELSPPLKADKPRFEAKYLEWYLNLCQEKSKEPSYKEFNRNLKKIRAKRKTTADSTKELFELAAKTFNGDNPFK